MLIVNCLASFAVAKPFSHPFLLQIFRTWDYYNWNSIIIIIIQIAGRRNIQHNVMNNDVGHILHDHKNLKYLMIRDYQRNFYLTAHQGVAVGQDHGVEEPVREILTFF